MTFIGLAERPRGVRFAPTATINASSTPVDLVRAFRAVVDALERVPVDVATYSALSEAALLEVNNLNATAQRLLGGSSAAIAGEVARRSTPELGSRGLAQRAGYRTAEQFIKLTTGVTGREATTAVRIGRVLVDAAAGGATTDESGELREPQHP